MEPMIEELITATTLKDNKIRFNALAKMLDITETTVDWLGEVFDDLKERLKSDNSYQRSIGMMLLCNLAKSDHNNHLDIALPDILKLIDDEKFITRRQTIQNIWKIATAKEELQKPIIESLLKKFSECIHEDHYNLMRIDIITALHEIYRNNSNAVSLSFLEDLIETEDDAKLKRKYEKILKP